MDFNERLNEISNLLTDLNLDIESGLIKSLDPSLKDVYHNLLNAEKLMHDAVMNSHYIEQE